MPEECVEGFARNRQRALRPPLRSLPRDRLMCPATPTSCLRENSPGITIAPIPQRAGTLTSHRSTRLSSSFADYPRRS